MALAFIMILVQGVAVTVVIEHMQVQGVAVGDRTYLGIYASKYYGVSQT